jgi:hypothetical protein
MRRLVAAAVTLAALLAVTAARPAQPPAAASIAGDQRVSLVLLNFANNPAEPIAPADAAVQMFTDPRSVAAYYAASSYGQMRITGDVYGWVTVPFDDTACNNAAWTAAARERVEAAGGNVSGYVVYAWPKTYACQWGGKAAVGGPTAYANGINWHTITHELGHSFGLQHANGWRCTDSTGALVAVSGSCSSREYEDPFDVMGLCCSQTFSLNATHRWVLGWLTPADTQTVTTSGDYLIRPIEQTGPTPAELRIPRLVGKGGAVLDWYSVEFRQPSPFDPWPADHPVFNGVLIHVADPDGDSDLVDTTPSTPVTDGDQALAVGRTLTDPTQRTEIGITTLSVSPEAAVVRIVLRRGTRTL